MPGVVNSTGQTLYFPEFDLRLPIISTRPTGTKSGTPSQNQVWLGTAGPAENNQDLLEFRTIPLIFRNRGRGMGVSQFDDDLANDGDCDYTLRGWSRTPGSWMPAGDDVEVDITALSTAGACTASAVYNGTDIYFAFGRYTVKVAAGTDGGPLAIDRDLGVGFVAKRMEVYEGVLYVAGAGGFLWRFNGSWSQSSDVSALDLATVFWQTPEGVISQRLIIQDTATSFKHIAEASTPLVLSAYSARYQIAGGSYRINSMAAANQAVWFATAGGLATVDSRGYSPIINPYLKTMFSNDLNGEASFYHDGYVYMSTFQGLDRVDVSSQQRSDTPAAVQPGAGTSAEHPIYGRCTAMCADAGYLVAAFYNVTDSYVLAGKPDGSHPSGMRWYGSEYHLRSERITHMRVHVTSPASNPCIWICSVAGSTPHLRYVFLPKAATPQQELLNNLNSSGAYTGTMRWAEEWSIYFGAQDLGDQNSMKLVERYDAALRRTNSTTTFFRLFANADGGAYSQQGTAADPKMQSSPRSQLIPTAPVTEGYNLGIRLDGYGATTAPGIVNQLKARFELLQEMRNNTTYQVSLGPVEVSRQGALIALDMLDVLNTLLSLQSRGPTPMIDQYGRILPAVKVEPGITWEPSRVERSGGSTEEFELIVTVAISTVATTEEQLSSGSGAPPAETFPTFIFGETLVGQGSFG